MSEVITFEVIVRLTLRPSSLRLFYDVFSSHVDKINKRQARHFLTTDNSHLRMICELAGRDASYVRSKIRKKLLREDGWNVDVSVDGYRKEYRGTRKGRK